MNARSRVRRPTVDGPETPAASSHVPVQRSTASISAGLLRLQGTAGNRAVQRQLHEGLVQRANEGNYGVYTPAPAEELGAGARAAVAAAAPVPAPAPVPAEGDHHYEPYAHPPVVAAAPAPAPAPAATGGDHHYDPYVPHPRVAAAALAPAPAASHHDDPYVPRPRVASAPAAPTPATPSPAGQVAVAGQAAAHAPDPSPAARPASEPRIPASATTTATPMAPLAPVASSAAAAAAPSGPMPSAWPPGMEPRAELQMFGNHPPPPAPAFADRPAPRPAAADAPPRAADAPPARAAAAAAAGHPAPLRLPASYAGEDRMLGWRAWHGAGSPAEMPAIERAARERMAGTSDRVTHYNTPEETRASTLTPAMAADGSRQLRDAAGRPADFGPRVYAMGTEGQVVANAGPASANVRGQRQDIHHSSMLAGADVAHAGHIGARGGRVNYLDDDSGHYRPTGAHTFDAFSRLAGQGALDPTSTSGRVHMVDKSVGKGLGARGPSASVHFAAYAQTQGNEAAIRAKAAMLGQLERAAARPAAPAPGAAAATASPSPVVVPSPQVAPASAAAQSARPTAAASAEVMDVATPLPSRPASPAAADDDGGLVFDDGPAAAAAPAAALATQPEEIDLPAQPAPVAVPVPAATPTAAEDDGGLVFDDGPAPASAPAAALAAQPEEIDLPAQPAAIPTPAPAPAPAS